MINVFSAMYGAIWASGDDFYPSNLSPFFAGSLQIPTHTHTYTYTHLVRAVRASVRSLHFWREKSPLLLQREREREREGKREGID